MEAHQNMGDRPSATMAANNLTIVTENPPAAVAGNPFDPAKYTNPSTITKMTSLRQFCFEHFETHIRASPSRPASHDENLVGFIELITASEPIFARARAVIPELQVPKQDTEIHHDNGKIQFLLIATNEMRGPPGKVWDVLPEEAVWRKQREIQAKGQRNANAQDLKLSKSSHLFLSCSTCQMECQLTLSFRNTNHERDNPFHQVPNTPSNQRIHPKQRQRNGLVANLRLTTPSPIRHVQPSRPRRHSI